MGSLVVVCGLSCSAESDFLSTVPPGKSHCCLSVYASMLLAQTYSKEG